MNIRPYEAEDLQPLIRLVAGFRLGLAKLRGKNRALDLEAADAELHGYRQQGHPIFVAQEGSELLGYLVCRLADDVVWAESLYVDPAHRLRGVGSALYDQAEEVARERELETVYNWIHPDNDAVIALLRSKGYDVLNLIEVRKAREGEQLAGHIEVGGHIFRY